MKSIQGRALASAGDECRSVIICKLLCAEELMRKGLLPLCRWLGAT